MVWRCVLLDMGCDASLTNGLIPCRTNVKVWLTTEAREYQRYNYLPVRHRLYLRSTPDCKNLRGNRSSGGTGPWCYYIASGVVYARTGFSDAMLFKYGVLWHLNRYNGGYVLALRCEYVRSHERGSYLHPSPVGSPDRTFKASIVGF